MSATMSKKPAIPFIQKNPPALGTKVKVWFDKSSTHLLIESNGTLARDIYGVCLEDVSFGTETTLRGAVRCFATGRLLAIPGTHESSTIQRQILKEADGFLDFHWWRDKKWPIAKARKAVIAPPRGGFPTSAAVP